MDVESTINLVKNSVVTHPSGIELKTQEGLTEYGKRVVRSGLDPADFGTNLEWHKQEVISANPELDQFIKPQRFEGVVWFTDEELAYLEAKKMGEAKTRRGFHPVSDGDLDEFQPNEPLPGFEWMTDIEIAARKRSDEDDRKRRAYQKQFGSLETRPSPNSTAGLELRKQQIINEIERAYNLRVAAHTEAYPSSETGGSGILYFVRTWPAPPMAWEIGSKGHVLIRKLEDIEREVARYKSDHDKLELAKCTGQMNLIKDIPDVSTTDILEIAKTAVERQLDYEMEAAKLDKLRQEKGEDVKIYDPRANLEDAAEQLDDEDLLELARYREEIANELVTLYST